MDGEYQNQNLSPLKKITSYQEFNFFWQEEGLSNPFEHKDSIRIMKLLIIVFYLTC